MNSLTPPERTCIVIADGARARIFSYRWRRGDSDVDNLRELRDLVNPGRRLRDDETFSESRPGLRQSMSAGPRHGVDDHRKDHREEADRRFATEIAEATGEVLQEMGSCRLYLLAAPHLLGLLRDQLDKHPDWTKGVVERVERDRDVTRLSTSQLRDWLVSADLLPPRRRLANPR